ncbi:hypothetical protein CISG_04711 [Coccidioides immitis RMSCC 3703]|uniref:Uncharacterized protein n=2 Tax=Coccidioides immitis TaxID=5501 RepID=A0A0J8TNJ8_COCIT|nr:hypothetical protein CIRG_09525 [Coccidioides immitis RMSCC 2394]KMU75292.1 hypothetical protein CISG_04711 [Coccidioides immitis RMSCC 3703]
MSQSGRRDKKPSNSTRNNSYFYQQDLAQGMWGDRTKVDFLFAGEVNPFLRGQVSLFLGPRGEINSVGFLRGPVTRARVGLNRGQTEKSSVQVQLLRTTRSARESRDTDVEKSGTTIAGSLGMSLGSALVLIMLLDVFPTREQIWDTRTTGGAPENLFLTWRGIDPAHCCESMRKDV